MSNSAFKVPNAVPSNVLGVEPSSWGGFAPTFSTKCGRKASWHFWVLAFLASGNFPSDNGKFPSSWRRHQQGVQASNLIVEPSNYGFRLPNSGRKRRSKVLARGFAKGGTKETTIQVLQNILNLMNDYVLREHESNTVEADLTRARSTKLQIPIDDVQLLSAATRSCT